MNNRQVSIAILGGFIVGFLAWWFWPSKKEVVPLPVINKPAVALSLPPSPINNEPLAPPREEYPQMTGGKSQSLQDSRWDKKRALDKLDPGWQGRTKISFYGRIIDQFDRPVIGATVSFTWTDLSPNGNSVRQVSSDGNGYFELTGVRGKHLGVRISKEGYLPYEGNRYGFEYAGFWEEAFHEPDPNKPVIFRMRKKSEGVALLHRDGEITLGLGQRRTLNLGGQTQLGVTLTANGEIREKSWSAQLDIIGGGIQVSADEFPFDAPENGYNTQLNIDLTTSKPPNWNSGSVGGLFYFKTTDGKYGRLELRTIPGKTFLEYVYYINPTPGSRNLEYDPAKRINP
jgi:hypothetical protein